MEKACPNKETGLDPNVDHGPYICIHKQVTMNYFTFLSAKAYNKKEEKREKGPYICIHKQVTMNYFTFLSAKAYNKKEELVVL